MESPGVSFVLMTSLMTLPNLCLARSDPMVYLCEPICWHEQTMSDQCVEDRCSTLAKPSRENDECQDACWNIVAPCWSLCRERAMDVMVECEGTCASTTTPASSGLAGAGAGGGGGGADEHCVWDCYTHNMMIIKAANLPEPTFPPTKPAAASTAPVAPA